MSFYNSFSNSTITCSGHKQVDLDALNLVASGSHDCLCTCSYSNEKGHHHFIYETQALTPFVHLRAGMNFEESAGLLASGLSALKLIESDGLIPDNFRLSKEYVFCAPGGCRFVYIPLVHKAHLHIKDMILRLLALVPIKDERIRGLARDVRHAKTDQQAMAALEMFVSMFGSLAAVDAFAEEQTSLLGSQSAAAEPEGETSILSQQSFEPQISPAPAYESEGETSVLSQQSFEPQIGQAPAYESEGETSVLSQQSFEPQISQAPAYESEGETSVLSPEMAESFAQENNTVYSTVSQERLTLFMQDTSGECETTVLSQQPQQPAQVQRTVITGNSNYVLYLIRNSTGERVPVEVTPFTIGKDGQDVDYALDNDSVSRHHATVVFENGAYHIMDNGSTNGTMVEGVRLQPSEKAELDSGYIISIGSESFQTLLERR